MRSQEILGLGMAIGLAVGSAFAHPQPTDATIVAGIQDRVYHAKVFKHGQLQVAYADGVATLTGTVDNLGTKLDAERAAGKAEGVTRVVDNIQVRADDVTPRQLLDEARRDVATYYAYGIFDNVALELHGGRLIVSGQVTQPFKKQDLGKILSRVRGVAALDNNLEVLPLSPFDDRLRLAVARAIYGDPLFVQYALQANPPIHIIVKNGQVTLDGVVANSFDRTRAMMAARTAGLSFSVTNNLRVERS
jgi:hyperosmotically inducible protein